MLVAVDTNRGESPVTVEVKTDDEATARLVAYRWVWYGDNTAEVTDRGRHAAGRRQQGRVTDTAAGAGVTPRSPLPQYSRREIPAPPSDKSAIFSLSGERQ